MAKKILTVSTTIDLVALDDPAQTLPVLLSAVESVLEDLRSLEFSDRTSLLSKQLPPVRDKLKDLYIAIDFLELPKSKGNLPADSEFFQIETGSCYRALELFLSFSGEELPFSEWQSLSRTVASLEANYRTFFKLHSQSQS